MENYVGKTLNGRYEVREIIGIGGMAIVYKAFDINENKFVAIKVLKEEFLANEEFRRRFKNESNAIAILSHPNIVKVFDFYFSDRLQYIVMEFIKGITLKEYIEQQKIVNWKEAVHFITQILRALQHAHDKGVVHRDIKPQNIMLLQNGNIKVTDFGIARFSRGETRTLAETGAIGSVHYISPEQARGDITDNKTDIYSVGVVLYELITGQLPFQSDSAVSVALMQVQNEAVSPRKVNPNVPIGLEQITLRAMRKNKLDRYQTAAEMLLDIDEFKRNPLIKFDYSYYSPAQTNYNPPVPPERVKNPSLPFEEFTEEDFDEAENTQVKKRSFALPTLIAVLAVCVLAGSIFAVYFYKTQIASDKVEVPNFVNKKYTDVLNEYPDFVFQSPPKTQYSSTYEDGRIIDQSPKAGETIKSDYPILLYVAENSGQTTIPESIIGKKSKDAVQQMKDLGFDPFIVEDSNYDESKGEDVVTKTDPPAGSKADKNKTVYIYVNKKTTQKVLVPNLVGDLKETAIEKITLMKLAQGEIKEVPSLPAQKGYVISQTPAKDTEVDIGSRVDLNIGSGVPENATVTIPIKLPNSFSAKEALVTYLNGTAVERLEVTLDGREQVVTFTGTGKDNSFKIYLESFLYIEGTIDFTTEPPTKTITKTNEYPKLQLIPDCSMYTVQSARTRLENAGFTNIKVEAVITDEYTAGVVIRQDPEYSATKRYELTKVITLYVAQAPATTNYIPDTKAPTTAPNP